MAVGKRRTRALAIDGQSFRWKCQFNHPAEQFSKAWSEGRITQPDRLIIRPEDEPHKLLTVCWPACRGPVVKPSLVRACILEARRRGWPADRAVLEIMGADVSGEERRR
jgi:hypothetical protein